MGEAGSGALPRPHGLTPRRRFHTIYTVVVNHEEQYSIWPAGRELPRSWREEGKRGPKAEYLSHIEQVWTDMRPLSVRRQMEEGGDGA